MDPIAEYFGNQGWPLRPNVVFVEGTTDEALFNLADGLARQRGLTLLGDEIAIVAAGARDMGGTFGVVRELITVRQVSQFIMNAQGRPVYRFIGLVDGDHAGRRVITDLTRLDRASREFRDIIAIKPITPMFVNSTPLRRKDEYEQANKQYARLTWEIEDILPADLISRFDVAHRGAIIDRVTMGSKTHYEFTPPGKNALHRFVQEAATLIELNGCFKIVRMLRSMFDLPPLAAK